MDKSGNAGWARSERLKVLTRFLLIGGGISLVLLVVELIGLALLKGRSSRLDGSYRWVAIGILSLAGLAIWFFFSSFLYRRLMGFRDAVSPGEDIWTFAEGAYGLVGVGIALSAAMAFLYYAIVRDFPGSMAVHGLAWALILLELIRFLPRTDELEEAAERRRAGEAGGGTGDHAFSGEEGLEHGD